MQKKDILDALSIFGAVVGSVSSVVSQQISFAAIPLSLSVSLHVLNRRELLNKMDNQHQANMTLQAKAIQESQAEIASLNEYSQEHRTNLETLSKQLAEIQDFTSKLSTEVNGYSQEHQTNLETLSKQLAEIQDFTSKLSTQTKEVNEFSQDLGNQHQQLKEVVNELLNIEKFSQAIRAMQDPAKFYYQRGLSHKQLEDQQGAMQDYTEAIKLDSNYAAAYYERGIVHADMGNRKKAVEDLRKAAKFYFESGNMNSYQKAKDLSQKFFDLRSLDQDQDNHQQAQTLEESLVQDLFS